MRAFEKFTASTEKRIFAPAISQVCPLRGLFRVIICDLLPADQRPSSNRYPESSPKCEDDEVLSAECERV